MLSYDKKTTAAWGQFPEGAARSKQETASLAEAHRAEKRPPEGVALEKSSDPDALRERLLRLVRQKKKRVIPRPPARPVDVRFSEIRDPLLGVCLTPPRAWELLIEALEGGVAIETIDLDIPAGARGYVLLLQVGEQRVYVKLEIGAGDREIFLRSYHLSAK
jgi:hypothetical protein